MMKINLAIACLTLLFCGRLSYAEDLLAIYQQALEADPQLKASELKIKVGETQKGQALGEMLPQVTGTANWSINSQSSPQRTSTGVRDIVNDYNGTRYVVSLNQTILDFPKFWNWRRAQDVEGQYNAENIQVQHDLMFDVVDRYFSVLEAQDEQNFYKKEESLTQQQLKQLQKLFERQLVKITDVYAIEARLDQVKASIIESEAKLFTAKESLRELTNLSPSQLLQLKDDIDYKELEGKLTDWLEVAKSENPALAAQDLAIAAADHDVAQQGSKHLPTVEMQLNYYNTNTGFQSSNLNGTVDTQVASINVNVPIFSGGIITKRTQEAKHRLAISKYDKEGKLRELIKVTSESFLNTNASVRRIKATRKALESASKSRESMETAYSYGVETISDVLLAQKEEFNVMRDLAKSKYSYIKNRIGFQRAIGMISEENLAEINKWLQPL